MTSFFTIRNVDIGKGMPKIAVPLTGIDQNELLEQLAAALSGPCDLIEWRADYYREKPDKQGLLAMLSLLRQKTEKPLIFTYRTEAEGGLLPMRRSDALDVIRTVIEQGEMDLVDIEFFEEDGSLEEAKMEFLASLAHANGKRVIFSNHDFEKTPDLEAMVKRIFAMESLGADIPKVAYMPREKEDVYGLLEAARTVKEQFGRKPFIALSMGELGAETRICGGSFGSAMTFSLPPGVPEGMGTAPGQMSAPRLHECLLAYYGESDPNHG